MVTIAMPKNWTDEDIESILTDRRKFDLHLVASLSRLEEKSDASLERLHDLNQGRIPAIEKRLAEIDAGGSHSLSDLRQIVATQGASIERLTSEVASHTPGACPLAGRLAETEKVVAVLTKATEVKEEVSDKWWTRLSPFFYAFIVLVASVILYHGKDIWHSFIK